MNMNTNIDVLKKEEETLNKRLKTTTAKEKEEEVTQDPFTKAISESVEKVFNKSFSKVLKFELSNQPRVIVDFPENQRVNGLVKIVNELKSTVLNFPPIQKISGYVKADVDFPDVQKISGVVKADVDFPDVQKVDIQKLDALLSLLKELKVDIPIAKDAVPNAKTANPTRYIPVRLTNGQFFYDIFTQTNSIQGRTARFLEELIVLLEKAQPASTTPNIYSITLTSANTEYSQALPANTRELRFRCRTLYDVRYAWTTGKVAAPTAPYLTLPAGLDYYSDFNNLVNKTIYFASSQAGVIVELEVYT